jgi:formylglycine-generating enzyme required for sulfatase activity
MKKILILASNPRRDLNLDDEIRLVKTVVAQSRDREQIEIESEPGVRVGDLQGLLLRQKPQIVHFCGHGGGEEGLIFKIDDGGEQAVSAEALAGMFALAPIRQHIECVLLNACYSEMQANAIVNHINYVVGMSHEIEDNAAIAFSKGFYLALAEGCSIDDSFEFGKNAIQLEISENSQRRSAIADDVQREFKVRETITSTTIPEHLKPILKKNSRLTQNSSSSDLKIPDEDRSKLQLKIDKTLTKKDNQLQRFQFDVVTVDKKGMESSRISKSAEFWAEDLGNQVLLDMVKIPSGTYLMGSTNEEEEDNEQPQHSVTIPSFFIGKYPISQSQWRVVAAGSQVEIPLNPDPSSFTGENLPVERISWNEAVEFCQRLSSLTGHDYRLPSEAEWEYACRAKTTTPFHVGETITTDLANYNGNFIYNYEKQGEYREKTTPVDRFRPNAFGLYNMHGNLWEWCADDWHPNYEQAPADGCVWTESEHQIIRVLRGGAWNSQPKKCRCAARNYIEADIKWKMIGFRIVGQL